MRKYRTSHLSQYEVVMYHSLTDNSRPINKLTEQFIVEMDREFIFENYLEFF